MTWFEEGNDSTISNNTIRSTVVATSVQMWKIKVEYATHAASHLNHDGSNLR